MDWKKTILIAVLLAACCIVSIMYMSVKYQYPLVIGRRSNPVPLEEQVLNQLHTDAKKAETFAAAVHGRANTLRDGADEVIKGMMKWYRPAPVAPPAPPRLTTRRTRGDTALERRVRGIERKTNSLGHRLSDVERHQRNQGEILGDISEKLNVYLRARRSHP